jgi:hypothetical protein
MKSPLTRIPRAQSVCDFCALRFEKLTPATCSGNTAGAKAQVSWDAAIVPCVCDRPRPVVINSFPPWDNLEFTRQKEGAW